MGMSYEECRLQRLEENKKRMEELNLLKLSRSLKSPPSLSNSSPLKRKKLKAPSELPPTPVRRSIRTIDKPPPNYKEYALEPLGGGRRISKKRDTPHRGCVSDEDRFYATDRAERLESGLGSEFPSCVKPMLHSHTEGGFWLSLPLPFCKSHLPNHDQMLTLMDEDGNEWEARYLARKNGLSGGWRGFAIDHELVDGDALVFQLINPTTFKVYIIRVNSSEEDEEEDLTENQQPAKVAEGKKKGNRTNHSRASSLEEGKEEGRDENQEAVKVAEGRGKKGNRSKQRRVTSSEDTEEVRDENQEASKVAEARGKKGNKTNGSRFSMRLAKGRC